MEHALRTKERFQRREFHRLDLLSLHSLRYAKPNQTSNRQNR